MEINAIPEKPISTAMIRFPDGARRVRIAAASTVVMGIDPLIMPVMEDDTDCSANG